MKMEVANVEAQALANYLTGLGNGEIIPENEASGICDLIVNTFNKAALTTCKSHFTSWKLYSGSFSFPVPGYGHADLDEVDAFFFTADLWANDNYGDDRRDLCLHIAKEIEKTL